MTGLYIKLLCPKKTFCTRLREKKNIYIYKFKLQIDCIANSLEVIL